MGTTLGLGSYVRVDGSVLFARSRAVVHEIVIAVFALVTTPVTYVCWSARRSIATGRVARRAGHDEVGEPASRNWGRSHRRQ